MTLGRRRVDCSKITKKTMDYWDDEECGLQNNEEDNGLLGRRRAWIAVK